MYSFALSFKKKTNQGIYFPFKNNKVFSIKTSKNISLINFQKLAGTGGKCFRSLNKREKCILIAMVRFKFNFTRKFGM